MLKHYRSLLRRAGVGKVWLMVWLLTLAVPFLPLVWLLPLIALAWLSALALAPGRFHGRRLVRLSLLFLLFWSLIIALTHLAYPSSLRPIANLAAWLALGLNLMLAKTPLELAMSSARLTAPLLGPRRAANLALALALLARLIPQFLVTALDIKRTLDKRAANLSLSRRLSLWAGALVRVSLAQSNDLSQALLKRTAHVARGPRGTTPHPLR